MRSKANLHDKEKNDGLFYCAACWKEHGCKEGRPRGETETYPLPTDVLGSAGPPAARVPVEADQ